MILSWGNYRFFQNEVATDIKRERQLDAAGNGWANLVTWNLNGMILNPGGNLRTMTTALEELENAFSSDYKDLVLYLPDGSTPSAHKLINSQTIGGVRVVGDVSYADSSGANYVTYRDFTATVQALVPVNLNRDPLLAFETSIQFTGGGPSTYFHEPLNARPTKGLGKQYTVWKAVQQGQAVGMVGRPSPTIIDPPVWPEAEKRNLRVVTPGHPRRVGSEFVEWPISWQYTFESADELIGSPRLWGQ
jgi:hypothetical protein